MDLQKIDRNAVVFELPPPSLKDETTKDPEDDKIFEITVEDVANMQRLLTEKSNNEKALIPRKYLEEKNRMKRENAWRNSVIRFKLFGKFVIQALFISSESVSCIFDFVNDNIFIGQFNLHYSMRKLENKELSLINADLAPKSNIIIHPINLFFFNSLDEFLIKTKNIKKCSEEEAELISNKWLSENAIYEPQNVLLEDFNKTTNISECNSSFDQNILQRREARKDSKPFPKWFKNKK